MMPVPGERGFTLITPGIPPGERGFILITPGIPDALPASQPTVNSVKVLKETSVSK